MLDPEAGRSHPGFLMPWTKWGESEAAPTSSQFVNFHSYVVFCRGTNWERPQFSDAQQTVRGVEASTKLGQIYIDEVKLEILEARLCPLLYRLRPCSNPRCDSTRR